MPNLIKKFKRNSYPQLFGNLLFGHLDKLQAYSSSVCEKVESQIKWVSFYNLNVFSMTNLICPLLSCMFNFIRSSSTFLVQETASKKKTDIINLINTWLILISCLLKYSVALLH